MLHEVVYLFFVGLTSKEDTTSTCGSRGGGRRRRKMVKKPTHISQQLQHSKSDQSPKQEEAGTAGPPSESSTE